MTEGKYCPFCGAASARSCPHLALAARATEFVGRCIENCHGEASWQVLMNNRGNALLLYRFGSDDFLWLETSFSFQFLERLGLFGRMEYEWREGGRASVREMWVLLWSKQPQRLWWQLWDELERQTDDFKREAEQDEESRVTCPVCGCNNLEVECAHLVFHGDDLRTKDVIDECVEMGDWKVLTTQTPEYVPDFASDFFDKFGDKFPSFIEARSVFWEGGGPGLSGHYDYVWS